VKKKQPNRRQNPRFSVGGWTKGRVTPDYESSLLDISLGGARIEHAKVVQPGTISDLDLPLLGRGVRLRCRVAWSVLNRPEMQPDGEPVLIYHTGLEFLDVPEKTRQVITEYIQSIAEEGRTIDWRVIRRSYTCDKCGKSFDLADSEVRPVSTEPQKRPVQPGDLFHHDHGTCQGTLTYTFGGPFVPWTAWVRRNELEGICVSLRELDGQLHVEQRVYHSRGDSLGHERIAVPINVLPDLIGVLKQMLECLVQDGLLDVTSAFEAITGEAAEPFDLQGIDPRRRDSRRERRVPLTVGVVCRLWDPKNPSSSKVVTGETKDVSKGGLQVWFPERFSLFSRVEVLMWIAELNFQARAEVVGAEVHPMDGKYRHSLRWLDLNPEAKAALTKITNSLAERAESDESAARL
jgi:c-di-GMP-binding flagellar brake protein YcgR